MLEEELTGETPVNEEVDVYATVLHDPGNRIVSTRFMRSDSFLRKSGCARQTRTSSIKP